ncbi:unnamed protein product [Gongylonema pulchrum]|uniref:Proton_antipo_M domain-containing protein n=1 Tax=Gongylonema pulchrum TaxID=637853 RepID=A0A183D5Z7_9BILA|nr:unnamed protein product [Gongylonema pulchrum]
MLSYSVMDMLLSGASVALLLLVLSSCHRSLLDVQVETQSGLLGGIGLALIATSMIKFFAWTTELYFLRSIGNMARYTFIHYTTDEPLWIALNVALGILCILRVQANSPIRIITLCLSASSIHPTITYLWVDYRWFSNFVVSKATFVKWVPDWLAVLNLSAGIIHLILLIILTLKLVGSFTQPLLMSFSSGFRMFLFVSGKILRATFPLFNLCRSNANVLVR